MDNAAIIAAYSDTEMRDTIWEICADAIPKSYVNEDVAVDDAITTIMAEVTAYFLTVPNLGWEPVVAHDLATAIMDDYIDWHCEPNYI